MGFGKRMFRMNPVQFLSIIICLGLAMMAQQLAVNLSGVSLSTFFSTQLSHVFSGDLLHYLYNVLLPVVMYMIAGLLLAGMGFTNFTTAKQEESKLNEILKSVLALIQGIVFIMFFIYGGKLFLYSMLFLLVISAVAMMLVNVVSKRKKT